MDSVSGDCSIVFKLLSFFILDIASLTGESVTAAGMIIAKLKNAGIIEPVSGQGKGKYRFRSTVMKSQA